MSAAKKNRGRPQITAQFGNKKGDHLWVALAMGWDNKFWARIQSEAIIQAALQIRPPHWLMLRMPRQDEGRFTRFILRQSQSSGGTLGYLVVRTRSSRGSGDVDSWYFIHGTDLNPLIGKLGRYSDTQSKMLEGDVLARKLKELFALDMHPGQSQTQRWGASHNIRHLLVLSRLLYGIEWAKSSESHELIEGNTGADGFVERLAKFIVKDRPLMYNLSVIKISRLLKEVQGPDTITEKETLQVIKLVFAHKRKKWDQLDVYEGLPSAGAKMDREDGRFIVLDSNTSVASFRKIQLSPIELSWEVIQRPDTTGEDKYLE